MKTAVLYFIYQNQRDAGWSGNS